MPSLPNVTTCRKCSCSHAGFPGRVHLWGMLRSITATSPGPLGLGRDRSHSLPTGASGGEPGRHGCESRPGQEGAGRSLGPSWDFQHRARKAVPFSPMTRNIPSALVPVSGALRPATTGVLSLQLPPHGTSSRGPVGVQGVPWDLWVPHAEQHSPSRHPARCQPGGEVPGTRMDTRPTCPESLPGQQK